MKLSELTSGRNYEREKEKERSAPNSILWPTLPEPGEELTGEMTCEVKGSASSKSKVMENWVQGRGVFLTASDLPLLFVLLFMLALQLSPGVAVSDSDSVIICVAAARWPPSRGVSSSGTIGTVVAMEFSQLGGVPRMARGRGGREEEVEKRGDTMFDNFEQSVTARNGSVIAPHDLSNVQRQWRSPNLWLSKRDIRSYVSRRLSATSEATENAVRTSSFRSEAPEVAQPGRDRRTV